MRVIGDNCAGKDVGIYSICSANRFVLQAAIEQALEDGGTLCVESTSNQVNQYGGYTGQLPKEFVRFVHEIAHDMKFPADRLLLGGDHLGPHVWRKESAKVAMEKANELVRSYVLAGYTKIHLDASMRCADDPGDRNKPLPDEIVSMRAAELCEASEAAYRERPSGCPAPLYVIGTEVPVPGGEQLGAQAPAVSTTADLSRTLELAEEAFTRKNLHSAWERVIAVVVQPGVEFGDSTVFAYDKSAASELKEFAEKRWKRVYEAHSTDYQTAKALREMVQDHFAILKVGPWLTFAFREAVFALASIEGEILRAKPTIFPSGLVYVLENTMLRQPEHWKDYYRGNEEELRLARKFSYSDRCRYYWPQSDVAASLQKLIQNLEEYPAPVSLISQFLPNQAEQIREGKLANLPKDMIRSKIKEVTAIYSNACGHCPKEIDSSSMEYGKVIRC